MYIAYIYDLSNNLVAQIDSILDLEILQKINDVSTASFGLYHTNEYCKREFLKEYRRVRINKLFDGVEKNMFDGVIRGFSATLTTTSVKLESFDHLFDRKLLHSDYTYTDQSIDAILVDILGDINTRHETNITLDCGVTDLTSKEYKKGESFLKVLKDLAGNGYEWVFDNLVLKFKTTIGVDRSAGEDFIEYRYDIGEPNDRSINNVTMNVDGKEMANGVIGKTGNDFTELDDPTSIAEFGLIESSFSASWDDATATQSFLDDHKVSLSEYDVDGVSNDFFEANLWDLVKVYIFVWNDIMYFDGAMKVIGKMYVAWDIPRIEYKLGKTKVQSKNVLEQIVDMQARVKSLELA